MIIITFFVQCTTATNAISMITRKLEKHAEDEKTDEAPEVVRNRRPPITELIDDDLLVSMIKVFLALSADSKQIGYNAIRALGNLAHLIDVSSDERICLLWSPICGAIARSLKHDKKLKNQWNACFAAGNAISVKR